MTKGRPVTIYAPATAIARSGVSVFRISGPAARNIFECCQQQEGLPPPRHAVLRAIYNPTTKQKVDQALLLWFPAPHSFTGEDVVELHTHGGRAVMNAVMDMLARLPGFRLAEAGEFSRRAFENDKLDLTEAEAIADLVNAETEAQRQQALRQMDGELGRLYEGWRENLVRVLAHLEATIDFSDEELPADLLQQQVRAIQRISTEMADHLNDNRRGERLRDGVRIAILGAPNAGKSSLMNALAQRDVAIVSSVAGTTRDVIEVNLDLAGYPVTLADTAGLRESADNIEAEGIRRALGRAAEADIKVLVFDGVLWPSLDPATAGLMDERAIPVVNKADLIEKNSAVASETILVSAKTGEGLNVFLDVLTARVETLFSQSSTPPLTRLRHRQALEECQEHLQRSLQAVAEELRAEDVRLAMRALGRITGRVGVEDLLDVIFRDFCIGK